MSGPSKAEKTEELIEKAEASLRREQWFEAERLSNRALAMARQAAPGESTGRGAAFDLMIRAIATLCESRRERLNLALAKTSKVTIIDDAVPEDMKVRKGCYVVQPPLVGSDARRLRLMALANDIPVLVLCREPLTKTNLTPIVAIGPESTLRVRVQPPAKPEAPDKAWMIQTLHDLGDWAIASLDLTLPVIRRIDLLLEYLDALPEHEALHHALEAACREAMDENATGSAASTVSKSDKPRIKS